MADSQAPGSLSDRLREDFHAQTAKIDFAELQRYFAAGRVVFVTSRLDLVTVAVELARDNRRQFEAWLAEASVALVSDRQAADWLGAGTTLWAVVADPWVLVQEIEA